MEGLMLCTHMLQRVQYSKVKLSCFSNRESGTKIKHVEPVNSNPPRKSRTENVHISLLSGVGKSSPGDLCTGRDALVMMRYDTDYRSLCHKDDTAVSQKHKK